MAKQESMHESESNQKEVKTEVLTSRGGGVIQAWTLRSLQPAACPARQACCLTRVMRRIVVRDLPPEGMSRGF